MGIGLIVEEIVEFERAFARYCGTEAAVSLSAATVGLDLALACLDLEPGDEVVCPALNFKASPLAVLGQGVRLVYCEIASVTFNVDPNDVERRLTPRTRAIFSVHMNGLSAPRDDLLESARRHPHPEHGPLRVIGDAARACGGAARSCPAAARKLQCPTWLNRKTSVDPSGQSGTA